MGFYTGRTRATHTWWSVKLNACYTCVCVYLCSIQACVLIPPATQMSYGRCIFHTRVCMSLLVWLCVVDSLCHRSIIFHFSCKENIFIAPRACPLCQIPEMKHSTWNARNNSRPNSQCFAVVCASAAAHNKQWVIFFSQCPLIFYVDHFCGTHDTMHQDQYRKICDQGHHEFSLKIAFLPQHTQQCEDLNIWRQRASSYLRTCGESFNNKKGGI